MKGRFVVFILVLFYFINFAYSYVNVSSCMEINDTILDGSREVKMNGSLFNLSVSVCFQLNANNFVFDCQGNLIQGNGSSDFSYGLYTSGLQLYTNVTIKNCVLSDWGTNMYLQDFDLSVINNVTSNNSLNYGIYFRDFDSSNLTNSRFNNNQLYGIYVSRPDGTNHFENLEVKDNFGHDLYHQSLLSSFRCNDNYTNITTTNGLQFGYFNSPSSLIENQNFSLLVFCNAANSVVRNVSLVNSGTNGVFQYLTNLVTYDNVRFVNNGMLSFSNTENFNNSYFENNPSYSSISNSKFNNNTFYNQNLNFVFNGVWNFSNLGNRYLKSDGTGFSQTCADVDNNSICDTYYNITTGSVDFFPQYVLYTPVASNPIFLLPVFG
ncbi:MAG: right-handed parallel beta-helix repeat-containing protein, partial [Nanoarchaeota archaeon]|nr:right-handed parallel beta-helix repeat-containing protein [Nanoarchaeota archaeon]